MNKLKFVFVVLLASALESCVVADRDRDVAYCGGAHRLQVVDLDMSPDPIGEGQRINRWFVRVRADASGECRTLIRIRDAEGDEVGRELMYRLRPGINEIVVEPNERYRFSRSEHCFQVIANIAGTARPVDTARRFCAQETARRRWSLRS